MFIENISICPVLDHHTQHSDIFRHFKIFFVLSCANFSCFFTQQSILSFEISIPQLKIPTKTKKKKKMLNAGEHFVHAKY